MRALRTGPGFRAAMMVAILASLCFVAPPAVLAFGHGGNTLHCLTHADAVNHDMAGSKHDHHGDHGKLPGSNAPGCCGLNCMSALPLTPAPVVDGRVIRPALSVSAVLAVAGRGPYQPDRPPIPSASV